MITGQTIAIEMKVKHLELLEWKSNRNYKRALIRMHLRKKTDPELQKALDELEELVNND